MTARRPLVKDVYAFHENTVVLCAPLLEDSGTFALEILGEYASAAGVINPNLDGPSGAHPQKVTISL